MQNKEAAENKQSRPKTHQNGTGKNMFCTVPANSQSAAHNPALCRSLGNPYQKVNSKLTQLYSVDVFLTHKTKSLIPLIFL